MHDPAFSLLLPLLQQPIETLWVVDENLPDVELTPLPHVKVISNRFDVVEKLRQLGWVALFSDLQSEDFKEYRYQRVIYRISKEKAVVSQVINSARKELPEGGTLILCGFKQEGIKRYADQAKKLFAGQGQQQKHSANLWLVQLEQPDTPPTEWLDTLDYANLRVIAEPFPFKLWSKPGIFGWNKIDQGSAYLVEHLDQLLMMMPEPPKNCLDLGAGYGYLSLFASEHVEQITATDNNAAALIACEKNFKEADIKGEVIAADCADKISKRFDLIVCNPPFHSGFGVDNLLTDRFIESAYRHLAPKGLACFVTNLHIPLESKATRWFQQAEVFAANQHFKLIRLSHPQASPKPFRTKL